MTEAGRSTPGGTGRPVGIVLAGGRASRLGGGHKGLLAVGRRTILSRIAERLAGQCDLLVLNVNDKSGHFAEWAGPTVADHPEDEGRGPLAGLLAGLDWVASRRPEVEAVLTVPSDAPFLPVDLMARLGVARHAEGGGIAYARSGGRDHVLTALWPVGLRDPLRGMLRRGSRRVRDLHAHHAAVAVEWPATPFDPFFNINTAEDLAAAERMAT